MPDATKALNAFTLRLTSSCVAREGVQEVAVVLHLLAIGVRERTHLVRQWRRTAGSSRGQQREPNGSARTATGRARRRIGGQVVQGLARCIREHGHRLPIDGDGGRLNHG